MGGIELTNLELAGADLVIPAELCSLGLSKLVLSGLNLRGRIPDCLAVGRLDLSNNFLEGPIPPNAVLQASFLDLHNNYFTGNLPEPPSSGTRRSRSCLMSRSTC